MLSRVYDHVTQSYSLGFQYLNLCWTDGNTTLPCDFAMAGAARQKECKRKKDRKRKSSNLINPGLMRLPGCQGGTPLMINKICTHSLNYAVLKNEKIVTKDIVNQAANTEILEIILKKQEG